MHGIWQTKPQNKSLTAPRKTKLKKTRSLNLESDTEFIIFSLLVPRKFIFLHNNDRLKWLLDTSK